MPDLEAPAQALWVKRNWLLVLVALVLLSLRMTTTVNRVAGLLLEQASGAAWIANAAIPSCLAALFIYLAIWPQRPFVFPDSDTDWRSILRLSGIWLLIWLIASVAIPFFFGRLTPYVTGTADIAAFTVFGPLGEEMIFRGAIFEVAQRTFPQSRRAPVLISTLAFSLHHFELHADPLSAAALGQVAFTLPMGLVFGRLRQLSGSLWPGLSVHVLTNLPGLLG